MLHQVGVLFDLYYDARKHKSKIFEEWFIRFEYACHNEFKSWKGLTHCIYIAAFLRQSTIYPEKHKIMAITTPAKAHWKEEIWLQSFLASERKSVIICDKYY